MIRNNREFSTVVWLLLGFAAAFAVAMIAVVTTLNPPPQDLRDLFFYMVITGLFTIGTVYMLYRRRMVHRFSSLRWTLFAIILLTVALVFVNVFITARLMFINEHDLILTSALLVYAGLIAVIAVLFISGALIDRIQQLGSATALLAQGDLGVRLDMPGSDELARLAGLFNTMASELEAVDRKQRQLEQSRRDLVAWASHDLRAPLAALRAMNEAILDGVVADDETVTRYRRQMQREIMNLERLIADLFELAQMDSQAALMRRPTDIAMLVEEAVEGTMARARELGVMLEAKVEPHLAPLEVAPEKIARVLYNLIDNALQHTPPGGTIHVRACRAENGLQIDVHNTGSFIAPEDVGRVFERFYRGEAARSARDDGQRSAGLGLAIARGFAEAHGGRITVSSAAAEGTTFSVWLPTST